MATNNEEANGDAFHRLQSSFVTPLSSFPKQQQQQQQSFLMNHLEIPQLNMPQFRGQVRRFSHNLGIDNTSKRVGIPPSHPQIPPISPYSQIPFNQPGNQQVGQQNFSTSPGPSHSRSLSQPSFFALDSLPPLSPSPYKEFPSSSMSDRVSMEERGSSLRIGESLPPRKAHRRSNSDIPFGFSRIIQPSPPLIPLTSPGNSVEGTGERKNEREVVDDMFSAYMNLDNIDAFYSSGTEEKPGIENQEDMDSMASGSKKNGCESSDNEETSIVNESGSSSAPRPGVSEKREGVKKRNAVDDIAPTTRHYRGVSMDSFIGNINFADESPSALPSPGQSSPANSIDANSDAFSLEFGNGKFSGAELNKITTNEKLAEIAMTDPKRAKRILANRQSAVRSKERKMRYVGELEHKVHILQIEATTLSSQVNLLQRDSAGLTGQNNELKFRLHALQQQAQLRDALNDTLSAEVQRLKHATAGLSGDTSQFQRLSINMHPLQQQQQSNGNATANQ